METPLLKILDNHFSHTISSSDRVPASMSWDRNLNEPFERIVLTDNNLHNVGSFTGKDVYGWLLESPSITPNAYKYAKENFNKFKKIFTFKKSLLDLSNKFQLLPIGGCWIKDEDIKPHKKSKLCSIIASEKNITFGHSLRHESINKFSRWIDVFGRGYNPIDYKLDGLKEYSFSIIIENHKEDYYFTEKLIDCFATGTIPIYWGCPSIGNFFDEGGIIQFNDLRDLEHIFDTISDSQYIPPIRSIIKNLEKSKDYLTAEDTLYKIINEK